MYVHGLIISNDAEIKKKMHTKNSEDKRNKDEAMIKENSFESIFIIGGMVRKEFTRFIRGSIC